VMDEHVGGRRWRSTVRRPRQMKEAAGSVLQCFLEEDSGSAAGLAWLRGARERCGVVGASALGAEGHDDEGAEADCESRAEWAGIRRLSREEERTASLSYRQRDEMIYGAVAACVTHGADVVAGRQCRRDVAAAAAQLSHARDTSVRAPFKRRPRLTSGPRHLFIY
jgi:hypothetical protein